MDIYYINKQLSGGEIGEFNMKILLTKKLYLIIYPNCNKAMNVFKLL